VSVWWTVPSGLLLDVWEWMGGEMERPEVGGYGDDGDDELAIGAANGQSINIPKCNGDPIVSICRSQAIPSS